MVIIKNFSNISEEKIKELSSSLNALSIPGDFVVEVWNSVMEVYSAEEIKRIQ